jgi:hypothetical protein
MGRLREARTSPYPPFGACFWPLTMDTLNQTKKILVNAPGESALQYVAGGRIPFNLTEYRLLWQSFT